MARLWLFLPVLFLFVEGASASGDQVLVEQRVVHRVNAAKIVERVTKRRLVRLRRWQLPRPETPLTQPTPSAQPRRTRQIDSHVEPIRHAFMRLEQVELGNKTLTTGANDVPLFRFRAMAARQDASITGLSFSAATGSLLDFQNARLYADFRGDGNFLLLPATARVEGDRLTFGGADIVVYEGRETMLEVRADILEKQPAVAIGIRFDAGSSHFVEGVGRLDGRDLPGITVDGGSCPAPFSVCWISVFTAPARTVTLRTIGNLYVRRDSSFSSRQLLLGTQTPPLLGLRFRADREDVSVRKIVIEGATESIDALELEDAENGGFIVLFSRAGCDAPAAGRLCADLPEGRLVIPRDEERSVSVRARLKTDADGGQSGEELTLSLSSSVTGEDVLEADGLDSKAPLVQNDGDALAEGEIVIGRNVPGANQTIIGPTHDLVAARIHHIENSNKDHDGSAVPAGSYPIGRFRFRTLPHENSLNGLNHATIRTLVFTVQASNVELQEDSFALMNAEASSEQTGCSADATTGTITVRCENLNLSSVSTDIAPGSALELVLQAVIVRPQITAGLASVLRVGLQNLSQRNVTGTVVWDDGVSILEWVDLDTVNVQSTAYRIP